MFSSDVYGSWSRAQEEKFSAIKAQLGELRDTVFRGLILDLGCGSGYAEKCFKGEFVGIDNDMKMLKARVAVFPCALADGNVIPFKDKSFDAVISMDSIHLISTNDFMRVLKPGGFLLISIFFNDENYAEKRSMVLERLTPAAMIKEFTIPGREKEYVVFAVKNSSE